MRYAHGEMTLWWHYYYLLRGADDDMRKEDCIFSESRLLLGPVVEISNLKFFDNLVKKKTLLQKVGGAFTCQNRARLFVIDVSFVGKIELDLLSFSLTRKSLWRLSVSETAEWVCTKSVFNNGTVRRSCEKTYTGPHIQNGRPHQLLIIF